MNVNSVLVERLAAALEKRNACVTVAESCTGGWLAKTLTDRPGSSDWFEYGFVSYGNNAKVDLLGVDAGLLERVGAVSEEVAVAMATGAAARSQARFAAAVTGVAGPGGGSADKPVGTVWFAWLAAGAAPVTARHVFKGDRDTVRRQTVTQALAGLCELVEQSG